MHVCIPHLSFATQSSKHWTVTSSSSSMTQAFTRVSKVCTDFAHDLQSLRRSFWWSTTPSNRTFSRNAPPAPHTVRGVTKPDLHSIMCKCEIRLWWRCMTIDNDCVLGASLMESADMLSHCARCAQKHDAPWMLEMRS
jgi:hypothetical protein